jgi:hypothetical protein
MRNRTAWRFNAPLASRSNPGRWGGGSTTSGVRKYSSGLLPMRATPNGRMWLHARLSWTAFRKPRLCSWKLMGCSQGSYDLLSKREFNPRSGASGNSRQPKRAGQHCLRPASKGGHIRTVPLPECVRRLLDCLHPEQCRCLRCPNGHGDFCTTRKRPRYLSVLVAVPLRVEVLPVLGPAQECPRRAFFLVEQISTETL